MSDKLNHMLIPRPAAFTQTRDFKIFIEPYINYLKTHESTITVDISGEIRHLYNFSLESFLISRNVGIEDIYIIMRMNGIDDSHNLDPTMDMLLIPNSAQLNELKSIYKNRLNK